MSEKTKQERLPKKCLKKHLLYLSDPILPLNHRIPKSVRCTSTKTVHATYGSPLSSVFGMFRSSPFPTYSNRLVHKQGREETRRKGMRADCLFFKQWTDRHMVEKTRKKYRELFRHGFQDVGRASTKMHSDTNRHTFAKSFCMSDIS